MSLHYAIRYLTMVLVAELAYEHRISAFTVHRSDFTHSPAEVSITPQGGQLADLTAASSQQDTVAANDTKDVSVLEISTDATATNPIETTAKTEEIKKNSTTDTTGSANYNSTTTQLTTIDVKTEDTTEIESSSMKNESDSNDTLSPSTEQATENTQNEEFGNLIQQTNKNDITTTEVDSRPSYSPEPVKVESTTVLSNELSTNKVDDTDSSNVTQETTGSNAEDKDVKTTPYWKKYTSIDRKPLDDQETTVTTEKDEDLVRAAQSHITLEKAFSISSDIPSLEKLKNELLSLTSIIPTRSTTAASTPMTKYTTTTTELTTTNEKTQNSENPRIDTMNSLRAGFLDYSARTVNVVSTSTPKEEIQSTTDTVIKTTPLIVVTTTLMAETTTQNVSEKDMVMKVSDADATAQSQMVDDAINEELMKESYLRDQSAKENIDISTAQGHIEGGGHFSSSEKSSEDTLSVKPISSEKTKTTVLYAVNPNYKPMKKIEVQPSKSFVRDPDDNSWRNESLSSLGIVFKANNSSKPFTQVLKNKTETELNSLLDKYNSNNEQELRERLEKMSEKRKTKRKKVERNGEITYVDYEEGTSGETTTNYQTPYIPPLHEVSPPPSRQSIFNLSNSDLENLKQPNTTKGKKVIIENFGNDADDDEGDYISLSQIDIQKFMTPSTGRTSKNTFTTSKSTFTPPPILLTTAPMVTTKPTTAGTAARFPERKATIQYFPPLQKQKVSMNDYDDSFRNKINSYTVRQTPRTTPTVITTFAPSTLDFGRKIVTTGTTQVPRKIPDLDKNIYHTNGQPDDNGYSRGTYVINHLKDFIDGVIKVEDDSSGYTPYPTSPPQLPALAKPSADYFDYDTQFRNNILDKFVENLNVQNERFKVDFPVIYNTSVVHSQVPQSGKVQASSSAFMRRLYDDMKAAKASLYQMKYDPNCDRTVELSPAYELHYYVPEDEEKQDPPQDKDTKPVTPYRYRT